MASVKIVDNLSRRKFKIKRSRQTTVIHDVLPFRIKFINVQVPGYGPGNIPPIGIAIIGVNDYIL